MRGVANNKRVNSRAQFVLLLALGLLVCMVFGAGTAGAKHHRGDAEHHMLMMMQWLALDENQQAQTAQIFRDAKTEMMSLQPPDWLSVVTNDSFDDVAAGEVVEQAQSMRQQRHVIMLRAHHALYHQVLNAEQQEKYRQKMGQWRPGHWKMKHGQMRRYVEPGA